MSIHEECGVFGVYSDHPADVAGISYYGKVRFLEEKVTGKARADVVMVLPDKVCGIEIKSEVDFYRVREAQPNPKASFRIR